VANLQAPTLDITLPAQELHVEPLVDGTLFPIHVAVWVKVRKKGVGASPLLELVFDVEEGRVVLSRFSAERQPGVPEISAAFIHGLKLGAVVTEVIRRVAEMTWFGFRRGMDPDGPRPTPMPGELEYAGNMALARKKHRRLTDPLLLQVAAVVRSAGHQPTKRVAKELFTSHRNATRWIAAARVRGFLTDNRDAPQTEP
jgi:hypothetical protein